MKRNLFLIFLITLLLCPLICFAMTQDEWNQGCYTKTKGQTTLYSVTVNPETGEKETTPIGSLPSGTYIHENTYDYDLRMWEISYYPGGSSSMGWVSRDNLTDATKWVYYSDGSGDPLPEALVDNPAALKEYMARVMPGYSLQGDGSTPVDPYSTVPEDNQAIPDEQSVPESSSNKSKKETTIIASWKQESVITDEERAFIAQCPQRLNSTVQASKSYDDYTKGISFETINIGTYCIITDEYDNAVRISYYLNGEQHSAYVPKSALIGAYTQYKENPNDDYSNTVYTGDPNYEEIVAGKEITWLAESIQNGLDEQVEAAKVASSEANQQSQQVEISQLGFSSSEIVVDGKLIEVKTSELSFSDTAQDDKKLAVIYAPKNGKVSLRKSADANAKVLKKVKAGTIVIVLEESGEWIKIQDHDQSGYVNLDCLKYHSCVTEEKRTGVLSYKGKTNASTTINIRNDADKNSYKVAEWKVGKVVTILGKADGWVEIEADGIYGYVKEEFITETEAQ